jgi:hypothetical protein
MQASITVNHDLHYWNLAFVAHVLNASYMYMYIVLATHCHTTSMHEDYPLKEATIRQSGKSCDSRIKTATQRSYLVAYTTGLQSIIRTVVWPL